MKRVISLLVGLGVLFATQSAMAKDLDIKAPVKIQTPPSKICLKDESLIQWHLPKNPNSFNDFTYTQIAHRCVKNSLINSTIGGSGTPTPYRKAMFAMKMLVNPVILPPIWLPGSFKPMTITGTGNCSSSFVANGLYGQVLGTASMPYFKLCGDRSSGGIGDDARSRIATQKTLKIYYPSAVTSNIVLQDKFGNPI